MKSRRLKIFVVPTSYPSEDNPVANIFVQEQVKALKKYECDIVVLNVRKLPSKKFLSRIDNNILIEDDGVSEVIRTRCKTFVEEKLPIVNQVLFKKSLKKIYEEAIKKHGRPDVIFAHFYKASAAIIDILGSDTIPVVTMEHSGELMEDGISNYKLSMLKKAVYCSKSYICTTEKLSDHVKRAVGNNKRIHIIPNVIDSSFSYCKVASDKFICFSLARLEYDKRVDLLVKSFAAAFEKGENVELRIGGSGPEYENIKQLINELGRKQDIVMLGRLDRTESVEEMKKCSCFVLPSRHETFGLVWREALCVGRPVITTNHGGFSAIDWNESYGEMIDIDSEDQLTCALKKIKVDYPKYDLKRISEENTDRYSMEKVGKRIFDLLKESL